MVRTRANKYSFPHGPRTSHSVEELLKIEDQENYKEAIERLNQEYDLDINLDPDVQDVTLIEYIEVNGTRCYQSLEISISRNEEDFPLNKKNFSKILGFFNKDNEARNERYILEELNERKDISHTEKRDYIERILEGKNHI